MFNNYSATHFYYNDFILLISFFKEEDVNVHVNNAKEAFNSGKSFRYQKRQVSDITEKLKAENKLFSKNNRLKVRFRINLEFLLINLNILLHIN